MELVRARTGPAGQRWLVRDGGVFRELPPSTGLSWLLALPVDDLRETLEIVGRGVEPPAALGAPLDAATEVWAAGVTYEISRTARTEESTLPEIYLRVYDADRPELFFKATGWRVSGPDAPIGIRADSTWNVPEPELAVVVNAAGDIVGYTICNDVSSRSLEGENPLYLPQAKMYRGSCAVGPWIRPAWEIEDPTNLAIHMTIRRDGEVVWRDETSTARLHRALPDLVACLYAGDHFPQGVVLATGTGLVPGEGTSLEAGDEVEIVIDEIGSLRNHTLRGKDAFGVPGAPHLTVHEHDRASKHASNRERGHS